MEATTNYIKTSAFVMLKILFNACCTNLDAWRKLVNRNQINKIFD